MQWKSTFDIILCVIQIAGISETGIWDFTVQQLTSYLNSTLHAATVKVIKSSLLKEEAVPTGVCVCLCVRRCVCLCV
jgi:hypothetical protein